MLDTIVLCSIGIELTLVSVGKQTEIPIVYHIALIRKQRLQLMKTSQRQL